MVAPAAVKLPSSPAFPVLSRFEEIADERAYAPVPDGWVIGVADVVDSTAAVAAGRYKAVNMAGAAVIAAVSNALAQARFPFAFGGDGAGFAVPGEARSRLEEALAATAAFVRDEFDLGMRVAIVPVKDVREAGYDLRVAEFAASDDVSYAMFSGGGLGWAENAMKAGRFLVEPASPGSRPDLTGLTCRFEPAPAKRGLVLSLVLQPQGPSDDGRFAALVGKVLAAVARSPEMARPIPDGGPPLGWPPSGLELEARTARKPGGSLWAARLSTLARTAFSTAVFRLGLPVGRFRPERYLAQLVANSDYRKYADGLRMTLDCAPELADEVERLLAGAEQDGVCRFGLHRQSAALLTCITPSVHASDHIHFVDGAAGGYAAAAYMLKHKGGTG